MLLAGYAILETYPEIALLTHLRLWPAQKGWYRMASSTKKTIKEENPAVKAASGNANEGSDCTKELQCIGLRIAYFRRVRNLTQAELADKVGINKNYLSHIECGNMNKAISLPLLIHISRVLNVKLSVLVDLEDWTDASARNSEGIAIQEMRQMLDEMCKLNEDLDRAMEKIDEMDWDDNFCETQEKSALKE